MGTRADRERGSEDRLQALRQRGWRFYTSIGGGARFMFAWDANPARVDALVRDIKAVSKALNKPLG